MAQRGGRGGGPGGPGMGGPPKAKIAKVMTQPINVIFKYLQSKARVQIWLYEQTDMRLEGVIVGFDEYMNIVLDDAEEVYLKKDQRNKIGRILLKGDNITLMMNTGR
eukprot:TRINITY_DN14900_c0_g1_i1.p1 TRINITY_DN14900_c0_g1~~TRINITY_DN14900_c0_g1_i1.p1  ORF type:complete len:120 (+),score=23.22 TRINITY_DN14900_c0_g1_i1:42-362(+)